MPELPGFLCGTWKEMNENPLKRYIVKWRCDSDAEYDERCYSVWISDEREVAKGGRWQAMKVENVSLTGGDPDPHKFSAEVTFSWNTKPVQEYWGTLTLHYSSPSSSPRG